MADPIGVKISGLPVVPSALLTDILPVVQGGVTSQETLQQILTLFQSSFALVWNNQISSPQSLVASNGYFANSASPITFVLPEASVAGDIYEIAGVNTGGWTLTQNAGQTILFGEITTTGGTGGSLSSTLGSDCIRLVCSTTNSIFKVLGSVGNLTYI